ncbi:hypothetical protein P7K49_001368 [Saguinus oedipus]|uniref:EGF-like domain-containing protein n=1 Tax=Saguinus oedipus TaxID=9490 RepID=A0ABQ9WE89_SAGOE|nr:hypothetical protein P7K49_001368 [Saguinus oedipus]
MNNGVCHEDTGECTCPPGFMERTCEKACELHTFGRACNERCSGQDECKSHVICLPDPYGCSCATGWKGLQYNEVPSKCYVCPLEHGVSHSSGGIPSGLGNVHLKHATLGFMGQIVSLGAAAAMGRCVIASEDVSALQDGKGSSVRKKVKQGNTVVRAMFSMSELSLCQHLKILRPLFFPSRILQCKVGSMPPVELTELSAKDGTHPAELSSQYGEKYISVSKPLNAPNVIDTGHNFAVINISSEPYFGDGPIRSKKLLYKPVNHNKAWQHIQGKLWTG